jgi:hypothetical protein
MNNWKKKGFFMLSLLFMGLFFFLGFKQDYTRVTELCLAGLRPDMIYHWLAVFSIMISCIFWWIFTIANPVNQTK